MSRKFIVSSIESSPNQTALAWLCRKQKRLTHFIHKTHFVFADPDCNLVLVLVLCAITFISSSLIYDFSQWNCENCRATLAHVASAKNEIVTEKYLSFGQSFPSTYTRPVLSSPFPRCAYILGLDSFITGIVYFWKFSSYWQFIKNTAWSTSNFGDSQELS